MSSTFEKHQGRIRKVLEALDKKNLRYKDVLAIWVGSGSGLNQLSKMMRWMIKQGYIAKSDPKNRLSCYVITEAGRKYLGGLQA